jgi:hypothetical protein
MKIVEYINTALLINEAKLNDYCFKCENRLKPQHFSRNGRMSFKETLLFMMNMVKKSLQLELNSFFDTILKKESISKQAYSELRQKVNSKAFIELNNDVIKGMYDQVEDLVSWNEHRLIAIDGTILELPDTELIRTEFGSATNQKRKVARARATCLFDVENKVIIKSKIDRYDSSERTVAKELIGQIINEGTRNDLFLFDRGYPAANLFAYLIENKTNFLMRVKKGFSKQITNAKKEDQIIKINHNKKLYNVRVIRLLLSSGEEEILVTSLLDETYGIDDLKKLYFKRWGIEVKYDELKNRMQIENFTGQTKIAIEQDFYAAIYLSNLIEFARKQSDEDIKKKNDNKEHKYEYKTNSNVLIGTLKDNIILLMLQENPRKRKKMFKQIKKQILRSSVPIRPGRSYKRTPNNRGRSKYFTNNKRCL